MRRCSAPRGSPTTTRSTRVQLTVVARREASREAKTAARSRSR
uniref:Uncharacterized protein n=1 Tax=Arundo donax TaxID=35708 RepID=A0A0A9CAS8_ARUDO